jgi:hypothetical protein
MFGGSLFGRLLLHLLPILDVLFGKLAAALAFAGVLEFALVFARLASAQSLAIIHARAIVDLRHLLGGSGFAGSGIGVGGGVRAISITLPNGCAAEQAGHGGRRQDFSGRVLHREDNFEPEHICHTGRSVLKPK